MWLSPFYPSALADGGYDVDDYRDVDPRLGTLDDFDAMVAALHAAGIKVIVDIVPNHTSNLHAWFVEALASAPGSAARARYIFRDGIGDAAPNDWRSNSGGPRGNAFRTASGTSTRSPSGEPTSGWDQPRGSRRLRDHPPLLVRPGVDGFRVDVALARSGLDHTRDPVGRAALHAPDGAPIATGTVSMNLPGPGDASSTSTTRHVSRSPRQRWWRRGEPRTRPSTGWARPSTSRCTTSAGIASEMRAVIDSGLRDITMTGSSTWLLGCHDSCRVASRFRRYPQAGENPLRARRWLRSATDACPATSLRGRATQPTTPPRSSNGPPGSTPSTGATNSGLPGCPTCRRVAGRPHVRALTRHREGTRRLPRPLPWTTDAPSFGFGPVQSTPQPTWFGRHAVSVRTTTLLRYWRASVPRWPRLSSGLTSGSPGWTRRPRCCTSCVRAVGTAFANFGETPVSLRLVLRSVTLC